MKKWFSIVMAIFIILLATFIFRTFLKGEEIVKLESTLTLTSTSPTQQEYLFILEPIETGDHTIIFDLKNDISLSLDHTTQGESIPDDAWEINIPDRKKGEKVTLKQGEQLVYPITIHLDKLSPGEYELRAKFSASNVSVDTETVILNVEK
ncbi:hypothetical protein FZW96_07665 [Bacillus sp. BGMRC 2118]|nr:hypothetical protein FZW96_07665 [Bacillus sp. BGMRC 2118]